MQSHGRAAFVTNCVTVVEKYLKVPSFLATDPGLKGQTGRQPNVKVIFSSERWNRLLPGLA